jgi:hypothetical protein
MGVVQVLSRQDALITGNGNILETPVFLEVCDSGDIGAQDLGNRFVAQVRERGIVIGRFDDNLVGAQAAHLVIKTFRPALGIPFDSVEGSQVRDYADLPQAVAIPMRVDGLRGKRFLARAQRASAKSGPRAVTIFLDYPILRNGIPAQFHATSKSNQSKRKANR